MPDLIPLATADELLAATHHDPFARGSLRGARQLAQAWAMGPATGWVGIDAEDRVAYFSMLGTPESAAALLDAVADALEPPVRVTMPRGTYALLPSRLAMPEPTDWDFRWTDVAPQVQPGEDLAGWLGAESNAEVAALLEAASPGASAKPGDEGVHGWVGVRRGDDALIAVAADTSGAPGVGHISSVATHPSGRGRGLGAAVTSYLTRELLREADIVTLGLYAHNAVARRLYDRLGFKDEHLFTSGRLEVLGATRAGARVDTATGAAGCCD